MASQTTVVLFTRDLRVRDHPALAAAADRGTVVPLFVLDQRLLKSSAGSPNRLAFLHDSLRNLAASLRERGARLVLRRGDVVAETLRVVTESGAGAVHLSQDFSAYARRRERDLARACHSVNVRLQAFPGLTVVPPGSIQPSGADHFRVFTPYWRRWSELPCRAVEPAPERIKLPGRLPSGRLPSRATFAAGQISPAVLRGGETEAHRRLDAWSRSLLRQYERGHDALDHGTTSRLSAYLRFGCVSPIQVLDRIDGHSGAAAFARQLCWRDFFHQVLAASPRLPHEDYRPRGDRWSRSRKRVEAWKSGQTGYPIVDAAMRQLLEEGFMHNRARLIAASFLVKDLYVDWRVGLAHFWQLLADGDIANNAGNWQWVAGTGNDTRPNRIFNPIRQAHRYDPRGEYVRRYIPELAGIDGPAVHEPWKLEPDVRRGLDYPQPIVDHAEAAARFRTVRRGASRPAPPSAGGR